MKLLVLTPSFPDEENKFYGGIFIKEQVRALSKHVDEINVISPIPRGFGFFEYKDKVCKDYSFDNVNVYFPRFWHFPINYFRRIRGDREAKVIEKVIGKKNIKFDLIHAHFTWPSGYAAVKLGEKFGVPVVVTAHGYDVYDLPFRSRKWFNKVKFTLENASHVITVSKKNYEIIIHKIGIPEMKVFMVPNGVNLKLFRPVEKHVARNRLGIPQNKKVILNVANLVPVKGHKYLVRAMRKISENSDDVILYIVGDGNLKKELQKEVKKLNLEGVVKLVGAKPHSEILFWMNAADIFVLPSLSEGNPTVMFEALGVGLPFVGTAVGGVPEIITSEDYGLLCEPANPDDLAEKILIALDKKWDKEKIRKYAEQFSWDNIAKEIVKIYENLTG